MTQLKNSRREIHTLMDLDRPLLSSIFTSVLTTCDACSYKPTVEVCRNTDVTLFAEKRGSLRCEVHVICVKRGEKKKKHQNDPLKKEPWMILVTKVTSSLPPSCYPLTQSVRTCDLHPPPSLPPSLLTPLFSGSKVTEGHSAL